MNSRKRNKLKAKRTPWIKSRYSAKAGAIRSVMQASVMAQGFSVAGYIRSSANRAGKATALAECYASTFDAVSKAPLYGSKTV